MKWAFWRKDATPQDDSDLPERIDLHQRSANLYQLLDLADTYGTTSKAGVRVSNASAMEVAAVFACVRVIAEGIAQLPLKVIRQRGNIRTPATDLSVYRLLHRQPNEWQTSFEFREALTMHAMLTGNGFAYISRVGGNVRELIPLLPSQVSIEQLTDYSIVYHVSDGKEILGTIQQRDMLHLRGPSWDTAKGLDCVRLARDAIGLSIATEEYQAKLHANGGKPGGILSTTAQLSPESMQRVREQWAQVYGSSKNAFKTAVLDGAWKYEPMGVTSIDAQTMEARRFQIEEICRAFRVFPQMVMQADKAATYASAEQFFLNHVVHSLGPWIERWEQVIDRDLLQPDDVYAHFETNALLRGATADRAAFYTALYNIGVLSPNEIRGYEELNPYDGGDEYRVPMNMQAPNAQGGDQ
jgi:HK97 family phage portal protein